MALLFFQKIVNHFSILVIKVLLELNTGIYFDSDQTI